MQTTAVVLDRPNSIDLRDVKLTSRGEFDAVIDIHWTGISTGTEKLLYDGRMPTFPGMGYPLVPGYEAVGRVVEAPANSNVSVNELVFVPGARCYDGVSALFGASASRLIVDTSRIYPVSDTLGRDAVLLSLAATAYHALMRSNANLPDLIIGHGVLGRLIARMTIALGGYAPTVWETNSERRTGADDYEVINGAKDTRKDYACILDASGDPAILDIAVSHMARGGEIILAGFYNQPLLLTFPPAFMREAQIKIAAEFTPEDIHAVIELIADGVLSLDGLITHSTDTSNVKRSYETAFGDPSCLKMILEWRNEL
ncbi:MAG: chlorophyll synthesis pathway protein BchC [Ahrensia sp.]|nr:chlorophyll synthesis pathway protein BchC [Ahrensia sp.]